MSGEYRLSTDGSDEIDGGEEVSGELVVARCDPPEIFDPPEHPFNGVSVTVEDRREAVFQIRLLLGGMFGATPRSSTFRRTALVS